MSIYRALLVMGGSNVKIEQLNINIDAKKFDLDNVIGMEILLLNSDDIPDLEFKPTSLSKNNININNVQKSANGIVVEDNTTKPRKIEKFSSNNDQQFIMMANNSENATGFQFIGNKTNSELKDEKSRRSLLYNEGKTYISSEGMFQIARGIEISNSHAEVKNHDIDIGDNETAKGAAIVEGICLMNTRGEFSKGISRLNSEINSNICGVVGLGDYMDIINKETQYDICTNNNNSIATFIDTSKGDNNIDFIMEFYNNNVNWITPTITPRSWNLNTNGPTLATTNQKILFSKFNYRNRNGKSIPNSIGEPASTTFTQFTGTTGLIDTHTSLETDFVSGTPDNPSPPMLL